jgi:hypothetical protein
VTPVKIFLTSKFSSLLFFCYNPPTTHKPEIGTANRFCWGRGRGGVGTTNNKPPGRIIMIGQSETVSISQIKVFKYVVLLNQNYFREWAKQGCNFRFSSSNFTLLSAVSHSQHRCWGLVIR